MRRRSPTWVFVSHSKRDLDRVREVRNALEQANAEPVLFFLKCLSDHNEIDDLIKREIEARFVFLLCDSANARTSKWVQDEVAHVRSLKGRHVEVIDLDSDWKSQVEGIARLLRKATAFLSYAHADRDAVEPVRLALASRDFATWDTAQEMSAGNQWVEELDSTLEASARFGYVLHFLSQASVCSPWVSYEAKQAMFLGTGDRYIPILLDTPDIIGPSLLQLLRGHQWIDYSDRNLERLLSVLLPELGLEDTEPEADGDGLKPAP